MTEPRTNVLEVGLLGAGRMGRQIIRELAGQPDIRLRGVWLRPDVAVTSAKDIGLSDDVLAVSDINAVAAGADVLIDFTLPSAHATVLEAAQAAHKPLVCGVSGLAAEAQQAMRTAARTIPVFYDRNMSLGVAVMRRLVKQAGQLLGPEFAAEIDELHHARKRDAPSGTALMLGETLAASRGVDFSRAMRYAAGDVAADAAPGDIRFHVTRQGDHPGRHTLTLASDAEQLSITHEVTDRRVFAIGALRAAAWLVDRSPGLYDMADLLEERCGP